jgi:cell division protein FtsB
LPTPKALGAALGRLLWSLVWSGLPPERRRARALVTGALVLAGVVILTSFPFSEVFSQRSALSSTARQLSSMEAANRLLAGQVSGLSATSTIEALARHDYGFVPQGDRAYDILPPSGTSGSSSTSSGAVPLDAPPVVPGSSRSQALLGVVLPATGPGGSDVRSGSAGTPPVPSGPPPGYWARVLNSLEFWN